MTGFSSQRVLNHFSLKMDTNILTHSNLKLKGDLVSQIPSGWFFEIFVTYSEYINFMRILNICTGDEAQSMMLKTVGKIYYSLICFLDIVECVSNEDHWDANYNLGSQVPTSSAFRGRRDWTRRIFFSQWLKWQLIVINLTKFCHS